MTAVMQVRTEDDARRLVTRIRLTAGIVRENLPKLYELVQEAKAAGDDRILGYASWTAYVADVFSDEPMRLPREERQQLVAILAGEGMSTRAIAPIVGVSKSQVAADIEVSSSGQVAPAVISEPATPVSDPLVVIHVNADTGEVADEAPRTVTGLDGKTYTTPTPRKASRKPLTDSAKDIGWDLRKAAERLRGLTEDDRFSRNKNEVAAHIRGHLVFTVEVCQDLLDQLNQSQED